jgi:hypothetical protein
MRRSTLLGAQAMAVTMMVVLAACTGTDTTGAASSSGDAAPPSAPAPAPDAPAPAPAAPWPGDLSAETLAALGVILEDGFSPHEHLGRTDRMLNWPPRDEMPQGIGDPPVPDGLGPLVIEARIERFPISCLKWTRTIGAVDAGAGEAAVRIADALVAASAEEHARFSGWFGVEEDCDVLVPGSATSTGDTYHELGEEPCALPDGLGDGPAVRCFVLAAFGYPPGAAHTYLFHHQLVFDTATGERLDLDALFAAGGVDPALGWELTDEIVRRITGMPKVTIRQARPTVDGLVFGFSPYEAGSWIEYTRDVTIPWRVYAMGATSRS